MKKFWRGLFCVAAIVSVLMPSMHAEAKKGETLHQGIWIGSVDVSGMTQAQAQAAVEDAVENSMNATITLQCVGEHSVTVTPQQLGVTAQMQKIKNNFKICDSVEERSSSIRKELETLYQEQERKEISDELFGRRSGTSRENVTQRH